MFDMGKILKEQRILRKMTQEQVARALDVTAASVVRWENNYKTPSGIYAKSNCGKNECITKYCCTLGK